MIYQGLLARFHHQWISAKTDFVWFKEKWLQTTPEISNRNSLVSRHSCFCLSRLRQVFCSLLMTEIRSLSLFLQSSTHTAHSKACPHSPPVGNWMFLVLQALLFWPVLEEDLTVFQLTEHTAELCCRLYRCFKEFTETISLNSYKILQTAPRESSLLAAFYIKNAYLQKAMHLNP